MSPLGLRGLIAAAFTPMRDDCALALEVVPQVVDHAGADEGAAFLVPSDAPGVAGAFAEQLEIPSPRVNAEQGAGELVVAASMADVAVIEDAVQTVQPAIGPPNETVERLMSVVDPPSVKQNLRRPIRCVR